MRFLADMGISMGTVRALREAGHDAVHLREEGLQRLPDVLILQKTRQEGRVFLTSDLDFGELLALGLVDSPGVVLFRLRDATPASMNSRLADLVDRFEAEIQAGALILVEETRYRLRKLPLVLPWRKR